MNSFYHYNIFGTNKYLFTYQRSLTWTKIVKIKSLPPQYSDLAGNSNLRFHSRILWISYTYFNLIWSNTLLLWSSVFILSLVLLYWILAPHPYVLEMKRYFQSSSIIFTLVNMYWAMKKINENTYLKGNQYFPCFKKNPFFIF